MPRLTGDRPVPAFGSADEVTLWLSEQIAGETDPRRILEISAVAIGRFLRATRVCYCELTPAGDAFEVAHDWAAEGMASVAGYYAFTPENPLAIYLRQGRTLRLDDVDAVIEGEGVNPLLSAWTRAVICAPLIDNGQLRAFFAAVQDQPRAWTEAEVALVVQTGGRMGAALELLRLTAKLKRSEAALLERQRHQAYLIEWSDRVRGETSPQAIIDATLESLGRYLGATRTTFVQGDAAGRVFSMIGEWRNGVASLGEVSFSLKDMGEAMEQEWLSAEPVCYHDIANDPRLTPPMVEAHLVREIGAFISIPLVENGRIRSSLAIHHNKPWQWRESEVQLLREIVERTWVTLERARVQAELQQQGANQDFLIRWADEVRDHVDPAAILALTLERLGRHLGVARTNYCEPVGVQGDLNVIEEWTESAPRLVGVTFPLAAFGERVIADHLTGAPVQVDDVSGDSRIDGTNRPLYDGAGVAAFVTIPMVRNGELVALMSMQSATPRRWTTAEVELLRETADRTWAVLARANSERRLMQSEAQLAAFMDNAPVVMHIKDGEGRYLRINPEFSRAAGAPSDAIVGRHPTELFPPGLAEAIDAIEQRALAGEVASAELRLGEGEQYATVLSTVFPVVGGGGEGVTAGVTIDLTERKRAEAALTRSREALFQTEKLSALGSLLAGVSHELNNPLSIVVAQAVMMERQARGTDLADRAQKIRKAADRCARIVQTFLAMARQKRPERAAVDINAVVLAAQELADYGLRTDGVETVMQLAEGLPQIAADSDQLHQIIINLIVNAQQAMDEGGAGPRRLILRTALAEDAGMVMLEVADSGPGVPETMRRRIFDPFFTTKPQGQGTGVGLSFSQGLAEAHGGRLELAPSDQGACFRLILPISFVETGSETPAPAELVAETPARRALVVDDEAEIAECLADFLSLEGFACEIAIGGAAAKQRLTGGLYDLVVSDLRMPGVDGPQLHAWIAAERPDLLPRLGFATGDTLGASAARFLSEAKRPVLEKPFMPDGVQRFLKQMDLA